MLHDLAHPMAVPFSTRRSAQAALTLLSMIGGNGTCPTAVDPQPSHVRVYLEGFTLWATRCDSPLLLDEAAVLARAGRRDVLILRFGAALLEACAISFDWVSADGLTPSRPGLLPALPSGGGLALVDPQDEHVRVEVTAAALIVRADLPPPWPAQRQLAMARAAAAFNSCLWGGL
jgi:hypothetical protein